MEQLIVEATIVEATIVIIIVALLMVFAGAGTMFAAIGMIALILAIPVMGIAIAVNKIICKIMGYDEY